MPDTNLFQIAYMPYAPIKEGFQIGNYEIWPFYKESNKRINNKKAIEQLTCLFRQYLERKFDKVKGGYDKPLEEVFIISPLNHQMGVNEVTDSQIKEIRSVCHIISFCAINECAFVSSSADSFILHHYSFQPGSDSFRLGSTYFSNLDMIKFMKPYYLDYLASSRLQFEKTNLCDVLGKALQFKDRNQIKRIFRTLELFYHTATYSEMMTDEHRVLSLVMCFEVLLDFKGKLEFAEEVEEMIDNYRPILESRVDIKLEHSKMGWWAYDLYKLRNEIVHGDDINWEFQKYGNIRTRIQFGGILIRKIIKKILAQEKLWPPDDASDSDIVGDAIIEVDRLDIKLENMVAEFNETYMGKDR